MKLPEKQRSAGLLKRDFERKFEVLVNSLRITSDPYEKIQLIYTMPVELIPDIKESEYELLKDLNCFTIGDLFVKIPDTRETIYLKEAIRKYIRSLLKGKEK